ncbi:MAG: LLM class flavin-dependent oxidoreductase [bacterium]|nr:LLM class flavin-dependent oxidoreductase [Deltaproteobacteria bacterium]MCP4903878.1 LLM class flavin-dependent oxidoreductase [bacterium]
MKIAMTLPGMDPGLDRKRLVEWTSRIEDGPFDTLAFGERMAFFNPELIALFGACAVLTERVTLRSTVTVMPMHHPVMLAKQLATLDVLSEGRLSVGLGIGGREEDLLAVGADMERRTNASLARDVDTMRRVWRGEDVVGGLLRPVEPRPIQAAGPELLAGAMGPRAIRLASAWAAGLCGFTWAATTEEIAPTFEWARQAWSEAGRGTPKLITGFWFALGEGARAQMSSHLGSYMNWLAPAEREAAQRSAGFTGDASALRDLLRRIEDLGTDEVHLVPTSGDPDEVSRAADAIGI